MGDMKIDGHNLTGVARCPHCGVAKPTLIQLWIASELIFGAADSSKPGRLWATYKCTSCGGAILAATHMAVRTPQGTRAVPQVERLFPSAKVVDTALPASAQTYLAQAYETLHSPDAAALMAASAVDAMLKAKGYTKGSLNDRIDQAVEDHILTEGMGKWAHAVRLEANNVRHADEAAPHRTKEEAEQVVEFADALGHFLFVLTAKIEKGVAAANTGEGK